MSLVAVILALMSIQGYYNLTHQWSIMGEFSNYPLEQVVEWINHKTPKGTSTLFCNLPKSLAIKINCKMKLNFSDNIELKISRFSDAVFAGPMPTMATVKLCTHRPIVNHPHYEDAGLRY